MIITQLNLHSAWHYKTTLSNTLLKRIDPIVIKATFRVLADESLRWIEFIQLSSAHDRKGTGGDVGPSGAGTTVGSTSNSVLDIRYQSLHSGQYPVFALRWIEL